jgi:ADP-heptose:LPS heptosyltransferase
MTWIKDLPKGNESDKCRHRVIKYLRGHGLDLGCGPNKITPHAIGVDLRRGADVCLDADDLHIFADNSLDWIYSSHLLEEMPNLEVTMRTWWSKLKIGGRLVLYLPHKDLYPNVGKNGSNINHLHDLTPEDVIRLVKRVGSAKLLRKDVHAEEDEYSFEIVFEKLKGNPGRLELSLERTPENAVMVLRWGAFGDAAQITPLLRRLKTESDCFLVVQTSVRGEQVLRHNPLIDRMEVIPQDGVKVDQYGNFWERTAKCYKKFINLSGVVEQQLLAMKSDEQGHYLKSHDERHALLNKNYLEAYYERAGYQDTGGITEVEFHMSDKERLWGKKFLNKVPGKFKIIWSLAGSGWNKKYPYFEIVARQFLDLVPEASIITVGEEVCRIIEFDHPRLIKQCGSNTFRQSCILASMVDMVVGTETGILNVAANMDAIKIILLSHSSPENLTKYWSNTYNMNPKCDCHPCHKLIYEKDECPVNNDWGAVECMAGIEPEYLLGVMYDAYQKANSDREAA